MPGKIEAVERVNRNDSRPLSVQIRDDLCQRILGHILLPGRRAPDRGRTAAPLRCRAQRRAPGTGRARRNRTPLLLLEPAARDASGRGLEWFNVWHRPNTVFDIDARVARENLLDDEPLARLRHLVDDLSGVVRDLEQR